MRPTESIWPASKAMLALAGLCVEEKHDMVFPAGRDECSIGAEGYRENLVGVFLDRAYFSAPVLGFQI